MTTDDNHDGSSPIEATDETSVEWSARDTTDGGWAFTAQAHYDPTEPLDLTTVIVKAIAEAEGVSMTDVKSPQLYEVVDIAGIETALFGRPDTLREGTDSVFEFRYNEYKVRIEADGWVTILRPSSRPTTERE